MVRELLLRRRIDLVVVTAPPAMTTQWKDELESKFGLAFVVMDRERVAEIRRTRGFTANPWSTGSRFIISHSLLADETYVAGLRDLLGEFRSRALLILDEAHHAAPAGGARYAISSQFTKAVRDLAERFEHRLFLSATPHNGHSNSFSALLEMLDPQRFTRGVEVRPKDLEPVMVRRLKADLRRLGHAFPARNIEAIVLDGLPADTPELALARRLAKYGSLRMKRIAALPAHKAALAKLAFVGLQHHQRHALGGTGARPRFGGDRRRGGAAHRSVANAGDCGCPPEGPSGDARPCARRHHRPLAAQIDHVLDAWIATGTVQTAGGSQFKYSGGSSPARLLHQPLEPGLANLSADHRLFVAGRSMRDVEPAVHLLVRTPPAGRSRMRMIWHEQEHAEAQPDRFHLRAGLDGGPTDAIRRHRRP